MDGESQPIQDAIQPDVPQNADVDHNPVDNIISMLGSSAGANMTAKVYRVATGKKDVFLTECPAEEFSQTDIQEAYGAGTYRLRCYMPDEKTGRTSLVINQAFELGAPMRIKAKVSEPSAEPAVSAEDRIVSRVLEALAPVLQQRAPETDRLTDAMQLIEVMQKLQPKAPSLTDEIERFKLMREVIRDEAADGGGGGGGGNDTAQMVSAGLALLQTILAARGQPGQQQPQPEPAPLPQPTSQEEQEEIMGEPARELNEAEAAIVANGNLIMMAARMNMNPKDVAEKIVTVASGEFLLNLLEPDNWFEAVVAMIPAAAEKPEFFAQLREEILLLYPESDEDGQAGDTGTETGKDGANVGPVHTGRPS